MDKKTMTKEQTVLINRINELCRGKEYTYYALAYKASIPFTTLTHILDGQSKNPGVFTIMKICDALDISLKDFFDTEDFELLLKEIDEEK